MTHYAYDALNRFTLTTYPDNTTASKTYDFRGNVLTETDQAGHVTKHVYDLAGREVSMTRASGTSDASTTTYDYDDAGRKVTSSHANGVSVSYTYDDLNRLETVTDALLGGGQTTYSYDSASNVGTVKYPNGVQSTFSYDALNRVTGLS